MPDDTTPDVLAALTLPGVIGDIRRAAERRKPFGSPLARHALSLVLDQLDKPELTWQQVFTALKTFRRRRNPELSTAVNYLTAELQRRGITRSIANMANLSATANNRKQMTRGVKRPTSTLTGNRRQMPRSKPPKNGRASKPSPNPQKVKLVAIKPVAFRQILTERQLGDRYAGNIRILRRMITAIVRRDGPSSFSHLVREVRKARLDIPTDWINDAARSSGFEEIRGYFRIAGSQAEPPARKASQPPPRVIPEGSDDWKRDREWVLHHLGAYVESD